MANWRNESIWALASEQHGMVARWQLRDAGIDARAVAGRVRAGLLVPVSKRILRLSGAPDTEWARLVAAVLEPGPGATASHRAASAVWGVPGYRLVPATVTGNRPRLSPGTYELATVHQPRQLTPSHVVTVDGLPVTTPSRTVFDLASEPGVRDERVERVLDHFWARSLLSAESMRVMLHDVARRGRPGITLMRRLLAERGDDYRPPESGAEGRFQQVVRAWGWHDFVRQINVGSEEAWIGRVDFVDRKRKLIVEVSPSLHHSAKLDVERDAIRHARLEAEGWRVIAVDEWLLFHRPWELRALLREARRAA